MSQELTKPKLYIYLRNLVRDRTCGSMDEVINQGGVRGIASKLQVDPDRGVKSSEVDERRAENGSNELPVDPLTSYWGFLLDAFSDFTVLMLCGAAIVSLGLAFGYERTAGSYAEGFAILISVLIVTNVTAINDFNKQKQFARLNATVEDVYVRCLRDGEVKDVRAAELVCGDVVQLGVGDILSADGLLIKGDSVSTDESALTGEPKLIRKDPLESPFLLSGTKVMEGSGTFLVIAVGVNSEAGQIRELIRNKKKEKKPTPPVEGGAADTAPAQVSTPSSEEEDPSIEKSVLTAKLDRIAVGIGKFASILALIVLIVTCVRYAIVTFATTNPNTICAFVSNGQCGSQQVNDYAQNTTVGFPNCGGANTVYPCCNQASDGAELLGSPCPWMKNHLSEFLSFLIVAITILVVAIPEGLPLAVTLSLAFSVRKMQNENNLVKHLDACETMGSATTICSDKTGTLTKNRMTVVRSMVGIDKQTALSETMPSWIQELWVEAIALSGNADIEYNDSIKMYDQIGSKTECALLQTIPADLKYKKTYKEIRSETEIVKRFPFSSSAKKSGVLVRHGENMRLYTMGASEIVLENCSHVVQTYDDGQSYAIQLTPPMRSVVLKSIEEYANDAMRTIIVAYKDIPGFINVDSVSADEIGFTMIALVGIEDPLRDEVPEAIAKCNRAGVDVKMVTGDNLNTAIAIARNAKIIRASDIDPKTNELKPNVAMTGPEFRNRVLDQDGNLKQEEIDRIWPYLRVLARSSPTDKYTLVSGMIVSNVQVTGDRQVVAVTGDGTNDAPALKKADVGFAMGITGTAVARDAADIILLDDNFASIVIACKWGRNVYDSIAKFLQFQLTVTTVAVVIALEGVFIYNQSPIGAVQMLWLNLIMDALASLALATEPPTEALLNRPPHGRNQSIISGIMAWNIFGQGVYQLLILNLFFFFAPTWFSIPDASTGHGHESPPSQHYTMIFNSLVLMQLTNQINSRKLYHEWNVFVGFFSNAYFVVIILIEAVLQVIFVQFGGSWVGTAALSGELWGISIAVAFGSFPAQWLVISARRMVLSCLPKKTDQPQPVTPPPPIPLEPLVSGADDSAVHARQSMVGALPSGRFAKSNTYQFDRDLETAMAGGVGEQLKVTESAQQFPRYKKQTSTLSNKSGSSRIGGVLRTPPVEELQREASGGFKNPRRQSSTIGRYKKYFSFNTDQRDFLQAAKEYKKGQTGSPAKSSK